MSSGVKRLGAELAYMEKMKLKFEKNIDMKVREWKDRIEKDKLKGEFDPNKDFQGEIYIEEKRRRSVENEIYPFEFIYGIRVTTCPYEVPTKCPWLSANGTIKANGAAREMECRAVLQTNNVFQTDAYPGNETKVRCKAHVAGRDRIDIDG